MWPEGCAAGGVVKEVARRSIQQWTFWELSHGARDLKVAWSTAASNRGLGRAEELPLSNRGQYHVTHHASRLLSSSILIRSGCTQLQQ
jgi:hypothetical protein